MKRARVRTGLLVGLCLFGVAWSPPRALGQCCGDCDGGGDVTVNELVTAATRALEPVPCRDDGICSMGSCEAQLATCRTELGDCRAQPGGQRFPASGQTTSYGPGSDGAVRAGATLSYTDNGDGTVTDNNTGLMWEKKDDSGGIHDKDNPYDWSSTGTAADGSAFTVFLAGLNKPPCFAGHCDWRIPNVRELQSIVDYEKGGLLVNAAFHNAAGCPGCTDVTRASCSCTGSDLYWSSTTDRDLEFLAKYVNFGIGGVGYDGKPNGFLVRAVRGGL